MACCKNGSTRKVIAKFTTNELPAIPPPQKYTDINTVPFLNPAFKWYRYRYKAQRAVSQLQSAYR